MLVLVSRFVLAKSVVIDRFWHVHTVTGIDSTVSEELQQDSLAYVHCFHHNDESSLPAVSIACAAGVVTVFDLVWYQFTYIEAQGQYLH